MTTRLAIVVLVLLVTGVATATVYALPLIAQGNAAQAQNGDMTQSLDRSRRRDCAQSGAIPESQERVQLRDCGQNCDGAGAGTCACNQGDSETAMGDTSQYQFCEQTCVRAQNRNRLGAEE